MRRFLLLGAAIALGGPVAAAQGDDACATFKWSVARERTAFAIPLPTLQSGGDYPGPLHGVSVTLKPQAEVTYPEPPARAPKSSPAYGAVLQAAPLVVAGTYQITLSDEAWIDVFQNGKRLRSSGFSGVTDCPGIRKSVRFALEAGTYGIAISDAGKETLKLDVLPAE